MQFYSLFFAAAHAWHIPSEFRIRSIGVFSSMAIQMKRTTFPGIGWVCWYGIFSSQFAHPDVGYSLRFLTNIWKPSGSTTNHRISYECQAYTPIANRSDISFIFCTYGARFFYRCKIYHAAESKALEQLVFHTIFYHIPTTIMFFFVWKENLRFDTTGNFRWCR
jgi:hypothetical protein